MKHFIVTRREVWTSGVLIEAGDETEALNKVCNGEGEDLVNLLEYSHTLDCGNWDTEEITEEEAKLLEAK